jgi:hypothetical protein
MREKKRKKRAACGKAAGVLLLLLLLNILLPSRSVSNYHHKIKKCLLSSITTWKSPPHKHNVVAIRLPNSSAEWDSWRLRLHQHAACHLDSKSNWSNPLNFWFGVHLFMLLEATVGITFSPPVNTKWVFMTLNSLILSLTC